MNVVIDTHVFISGIFWAGPPSKILDLWQTGKLKICVSPEILTEYIRVGESLSQKFTNIDISPFIEMITVEAKITATPKLPFQISRDPDDDKFLACALSADAEFIITGDDDLLVLKEFAGIKIIKPRCFIENEIN